MSIRFNLSNYFIHCHSQLRLGISRQVYKIKTFRKLPNSQYFFAFGKLISYRKLNARFQPKAGKREYNTNNITKKKPRRTGANFSYFISRAASSL